MLKSRTAFGLAIALSLLPFTGHAAPYQLTDSDRAAIAAESVPNEDVAARLKGPPIVIDGQHLHPKLQYYLEQIAARGEDPAKKRATQREALLDPVKRVKLRQAIDRAWTMRSRRGVPVRTQDTQIPGTGGEIAARIYTPTSAEEGPLPVLLYMHGGGWIISSMDAAGAAVGLIADEAKVIVVSIEYRMAPEHKFPAAHQDASSALDWIEQHAAEFGGDPARIGVGGDSAGGNMAAWLSAKRLEQGRPVPKAQLLYYPAVDLNLKAYPSFKPFAEGYALDKQFAELAFALTFANTKERRLASPILAKSLRGIPPTIIATAGFDMLRDQGRAYARRLIEDGGNAVYLNYPSLIHGFMQFSGTIDDADAACVESARLFGDMIRSAPPYGTR